MLEFCRRSRSGKKYPGAQQPHPAARPPRRPTPPEGAAISRIFARNVEARPCPCSAAIGAYLIALVERAAVRGTGVTEHWIGLPHQSALMLRARMTLPHFSTSSAMSLLKSDGEPTNAVPPSSESRALILGIARPTFSSLLSRPMISVGVFLGAPIATNALASKPGRKSPNVGTFGS